MFVRVLQQQEIGTALQLIGDTFMIDVAPEYSQEGIDSFLGFIDYSRIMQKWYTGELVFFGAFEGMQLLGAGAIQNGRHIALLYVQKVHQRRGVGRMLFQEMYKFSLFQCGEGKVTVNAAPNSVKMYQKLGMTITGPRQTQEGIIYIPMEITTSQSFMHHEKKSSAGAIIGIVVGCLLFVLLFIGVGMYTIGMSISENRSENLYPYDDYQPYDEDLYEDDTLEDLSGLNQITPYVEDDITYQIEDKTYEYDAEDTKTTTIYFDVKYPEITGLGEDVQKKVNEALKTCALETVDKIYLNPSDKVKESVLESDYPILSSYVSYKVVYQGKEFISVAFEDISCQGSDDKYIQQLRTVNISLRDGTIYNVDDIVKLNDSFITEWQKSMRSEADTEDLISELNNEQMKKVLSGDDMNGIYADCFFVHEGGIEIGISFQYPDDDENKNEFVWVTAPFSLEDLETYKTDSKFWKEIF